MALSAGGATAKPFTTHHNELDMDLYLRIAPELYLKRLVIGGMDRVFEIGKNFRNEGIDMTHNPEFTSCEFYIANANYIDLIQMTEQLLVHIITQIQNKKNQTNTKKDPTNMMDLQKIPYYDKETDTTIMIDFMPPYKRIRIMDELEKILGIKFPNDLESQQMNDLLKDILNKEGIVCSLPLTSARMIDKLVGYFIEPQCMQPTFLMDHPKLMSPLAKSIENQPELTERFELFVARSELCNSYTELNDPDIQTERFQQQTKQKDAGDDEIQNIDQTFLQALDLGLPPTSGWGIGIDRLVMLLTGKNNIREVITFPLMRPTQTNQPLYNKDRLQSEDKTWILYYDERTNFKVIWHFNEKYTQSYDVIGENGNNQLQISRYDPNITEYIKGIITVIDNMLYIDFVNKMNK
jgi:lysyl-tRNA synthetase class 2